MAHMANNTLQYASLSPANVYSGVDESGERESVEGVCDMFAQFTRTSREEDQAACKDQRVSLHLNVPYIYTT
jgi:hypothetical protein